MNFMEAVREMKLGKKVKGSDHHPLESQYDELNDYWIVKNKYKSVSFSIKDVEATDWEVVDDDKDWNLADKEVTGTHNFKRVNYNEYIKEDVKKCRDLILDDINNLYPDTMVGDTPMLKEAEYHKIINKRFGDL